MIQNTAPMFQHLSSVYVKKEASSKLNALFLVKIVLKNCRS